MWAQVWNWLAENYPIMIVIAVVAVIVWLIARFYYTRMVKAEDGIKNLSVELKNLPCAEREKMNLQILDNLNTIITYLKIKDSKAAVLFSQKESPRKLNAQGISLFNECAGQKFINDNKEQLLSAIESKNPRTALDVEQYANEVLVSRLNSEIFNELKQWVYNSPSIQVDVSGRKVEYALTMNDICFILSIPLRDLYLDYHPEIEQN